MLFVNGRLMVRLLEKEDAWLLAKWLSDPVVLEFYEGRDNPFDMNKVNEKFYQRENGVARCIIEYDDAAIGYIQFYKLEEESRQLYGYEDETELIYGMDQFIGETEYWNKGIGTLLVQSMVDFLIEEKQADRVVMDPQTWNERAVRCYEKCGFKKVKLLPKNEWHEGEFRDCWLIEKGNICS
ncbi:GNAT family N-acetyltransferase [Falsibacillus pallidus]|uniref:Aminoglycoside 6'-N-acetyltransferase n=1 Tax=Falsibacillus pallidus TaxID=493781 RepID=A0A370G315_9BACI|nr:GNAT family N-acetyltransferase [Falsibacillus pallidus]RDI37219.1 aminoglycoside 6'-N-acetyltransferase [Falsibacillus pallidus]